MWTKPVASEILRYIGAATKTGKGHPTSLWRHLMVGRKMLWIPCWWCLKYASTFLPAKLIWRWPRSIRLLSKGGDTYFGLQRIKSIRKLLQDAGITCSQPKKYFPYTNEYLDKLKLLPTFKWWCSKTWTINVDFIKEIENKMAMNGWSTSCNKRYVSGKACLPNGLQSQIGQRPWATMELVMETSSTMLIRPDGAIQKRPLPSETIVLLLQGAWSDYITF